MLAVKPHALVDLTTFNQSLGDVRHVAVAVSGGSDSMALLHLLREWQPGSLKIYVLTVDHGLRPEAALEAAQVARWCAALGHEHHTICWQGQKPKTGIQDKARVARYDLMAKWCAEHDVQILLTGHTLDDQAETVLMRGLRTTSVKSRAGIWPERDWKNVRLVRPLLGLSRQELRDYLGSINVAWLDDPSNQNEVFERVRIRNQLHGQSGGAAEAVFAQAEVRAAQTTATAWLAMHLKVEDTGLTRIPTQMFVQQDGLVKDEILSRLLRLVCEDQMPDLAKRLALINWFEQEGAPRRSLGGMIFAKRKNEILVAREPARILADTGTDVWDRRFMIPKPPSYRIVAAGLVKQLKRRTDIPAFVDAGLPVIMRENVVFAAPFHGYGATVECRFIGY